MLWYSTSGVGRFSCCLLYTSMTDQHTVYNSRMFCTRWNGLEKGSIFDDALDDKEYEGNLIYLLNSGSESVSYTHLDPVPPREKRI